MTLPAALLLTALTQVAASATLPAKCIATIAKAAALIAAGKAASGVVSAKVVALADGTLAGMGMGTVKLILIAATLLLASLTAAAEFAAYQDTPPEKTKAEAKPMSLQQKAEKGNDAHKPRFDLHGDQLPPGILKRFGTTCCVMPGLPGSSASRTTRR